MTNYLVLQVGGEALGQQPITRKTNSKAKNTTTNKIVLYRDFGLSFRDYSLRSIFFKETYCLKPCNVSLRNSGKYSRLSYMLKYKRYSSILQYILMLAYFG